MKGQEKVKAWEQVEKELITIFEKELSEGKFADDSVGSFQQLADFMPRGQQLVIDKLLDKEFLDKYFEKWSKVMEDPQKMTRMLEII